ncbi:Mitochondrial presequence protease [Ceratocystis lukuohia]|uniref:Presequence protease, mitochondrial n=2 Tax=Ceratocystis TaxID=5157 RepID=A0A0F8AZW0_CERFI|nr:Mitochondrial presequence protease [Ceratocystis platani]
MLRSSVKAIGRRNFASVAQPSAIGEKINGFTLLRSKRVPELELTAIHLKHDKTGADYLHIQREDNNNVFSIGFKTNPPDDTGIPHILEHTTLCGSEKYPVRDPFFKMLPRSLSNFMNAFTAFDYTYYPFATTNEQDFKNLMSVYLDATLNPLLKETDFTQEGWRIGPENPQAKVGEEGGKLVFKGVVYNEMKGQMSDASYLYYIRFKDYIHPSVHNSGGDPEKITDLTYEQLKAFHARNYHPSNAKFFTYGDFPFEEHLKQINEHLSSFRAEPRSLEIKNPIDLSSGPQEVVLPGPVDPLVPEDKQYKSSITWVMGDMHDGVEAFALSLMTNLLIDGYGSPLYKGLIESGLGVDWSPNSGYSRAGSRNMFSVGLTGLKKEDVPQLKARIQEIFKEAKRNGFEKSKIDGIMHQLELSLKHKTASFGTGLLSKVFSRWFAGIDPFETLKWNDIVKAIQANLAKGNYLEDLLERYLINDKTLTFTMEPATNFADELVKEEQDRLSTKIEESVKSFGSEEAARRHFEERELELLEQQNQTQDLSALPTVYVKDIPRSKEAPVLSDEEVLGVPTQWREAPTNGITYFRAIMEVNNLPEELRKLLPLLIECMGRLGTHELSTEQFEDLIKLKTGGISLGYHSTPSPTDFKSAKEGVILTGMALDRNVTEMFDLFQKFLRDTNFEREDAPKIIAQLLQSSADGVVNDIASTGHRYAYGYAESGVNRNGWLSQQVEGLAQVELMTSLARSIKPEWDSIKDLVDQLLSLRNIILASGNMRASITCDSESVAANRASLSQFIASFSSSLSAPQKQIFGFDGQPLTLTSKAFFPLPYQVFYGGMSLPAVSYTNPETAPLEILAKLLSDKHLHQEIREKGGAYGGGAYYSGLNGIFGFYSYRDPNPQNTLSIMTKAGEWAVNREWTTGDLDEAKISVFKGLDAPKSVNQIGLGRFLSGVNHEMMEIRRQQLLDVTNEQVQNVANKYIIDGIAKNVHRVAFLGPKQSWVDSSWTVRDMGNSL